MKILIWVFALLPLTVLADAPGPYQSLAFLAGGCWKGDLPRQGSLKQGDEHCFSWVYPGLFIRDLHRVRSSDGRPDYQGETIYYWDAKSQQLQYLYVESDGGHSEGTVTSAGDALVFPATDYVDDGKTQTYRSRWQRSGTDAYDVITEFKVGDGWKTAWTVHMQRTAAH
jgi:hypothetical protein